MEKIKIDMFSNLKIGDKFKLVKMGYIVYEKLGNDKFKEVLNGWGRELNSEIITAKQDDLFCVVYPL